MLKILFRRLYNRLLNQNNNLSLNIEDKSSFTKDYKAIVNYISDKIDTPNVRINKNVSDKEYFIVNYSYYDATVKLVYRTRDYYLLGFIGKSNIYYYFTDSSVKTVERIGSHKDLGYDGSYIRLGMPGEYKIDNIASYITTLQNFDGRNPINLQKALSTIIFSTAEVFRFKSIAIAMQKIIGTQNSINSTLYEDDIKNWLTLSQQALKDSRSALEKINIAKKF